MNILSHCISQVLHGKQMAYSNSDCLRRFYLQRYYFQRCGQSGGKPSRMCSNPKLGAAWLLPHPGQRGQGEGTVMGPQKERGQFRDGKCDLQPSWGHQYKKTPDCTQLPPSKLQPKLPISRSQTKIQGQRSQECSSYLSASWENSRWMW